MFVNNITGFGDGFYCTTDYDINFNYLYDFDSNKNNDSTCVVTDKVKYEYITNN